MVWPFTEKATCARGLWVGEVIKRVCLISWSVDVM